VLEQLAIQRDFSVLKKRRTVGIRSEGPTRVQAQLTL